MSVTDAQRSQLLRPINPKRVGSDGRGYAHVEAYEVRAHLNRLFDFTGWSEEVTINDLVFETENNGKWTVCYRARCTLTIEDFDGMPGASYTEWATGEAKNQPSRGDAHDLAMKTAQSQALKRAAANLGDQFGLSLYAKGSKDALVRAVIGHEVKAAAKAVDSHITEQVVPEVSEPVEKVETRTTSTRPVAVKDTVAELRDRVAIIQGKRGKPA